VAALVLAVFLAACSGSGGSSGGSGAADRRHVRLVAPEGLRGLLERERAARGSTSTTTTLPVAPFAVAEYSATFTDPSRPSPTGGGDGEPDGRTFSTTIWYPAAVAPTAATPTPPAAPGRHPLVVFAHGYGIDAAAYASLLVDIAVGGFVVAAPDFPGTSTAYSNDPVREDALEQPADISFAITSLLELDHLPGPLHDAVDPQAIGVTGHSDGGVTATAAGWNTCSIDPRIKAGVVRR
jgi:hypothetical protein